MMRGLNHPRYGGETEPFDYTKAVTLSLRTDEEPLPDLPSTDDPGELDDDEVYDDEGLDKDPVNRPTV